MKTTGGTGGGGTDGANNQARRITAYNMSTKVATVTPNWETTPDSTTTYDVLAPEGVALSMLKALTPTTAGRTLDVTATGEAGLDFANTDLSAAQVNTKADTALADVNLDHLVGTATGIPAVPVGTFLDQVMRDGTQIFDRTTDSLQAIRDRGDSAWGGSGGETRLREGTAQAGAAGTITLDAGASAVTDFYKNCICALTAGTGAGQSQIISTYNGTTKVATMAASWATAPDATTQFRVLPLGTIPGASAPDADTVAEATLNKLAAQKITVNR